MFLPRIARAGFETLAEYAQRAGLTVAYSIKTNPAPDLMGLAREQGFLAEAISEEEVDWALASGFHPGEVLFNGPVPWHGSMPLRALFADSIESFADYVRQVTAGTVGIRLRPKGVQSRFGIDLETAEHQRLIDILRFDVRVKRIGVSMHVPEARVGLERWVELAAQTIDSAAALESDTKRPIAILNLGGGWASESVGTEWSDALNRVARAARAKLTSLEEIIIEPGRCLAEPSCALVARVVEVRARGGGEREAVLDASIAEVPTAPSQPHRVALCRPEQIDILGRGAGRLLGRTCMENDILAVSVNLDEVRAGDVLAILDVGAYDASMAYRFGTGFSTQHVTVETPSKLALFGR
jgi:diaminopimelate decarboxylase